MGRGQQFRNHGFSLRGISLGAQVGGCFFGGGFARCLAAEGCADEVENKGFQVPGWSFGIGPLSWVFSLHLEIMSTGLIQIFGLFLTPPILSLYFHKTHLKALISVRVQRDLNPRPTAPQAAILSKLNYGPKLF